MLSRGRSNSRKNKKSQVSVIGEGTFLGLQFAHYLEDIKDSSEVLTINPDVNFVGDTVIFDYSRTTSKDNLDELKVFFENTVSAGDTITVTGGEYTNALTGDAGVYDIGGTYTFTKFDSNNLLVFLTKSSINNESSTYSKYEARYFLSESVQWTTESVTTKTIEINEIVNLFGKRSLNSFSNVFGEVPQEGDILQIQLNQKSDITEFTVLGFYVDDENQEHIVVQEELPEYGTTKVGEELFIRLSRTELIRKSSANMSDSDKGACCVTEEEGEFGTFCDEVSWRTCDAWRDQYYRAKFHRGKSCSEIQCLYEQQVGACCYGDGQGPNNEWCRENTPPECQQYSGFWQGANTTCADAGCEPDIVDPPIGACCLNEQCHPTNPYFGSRCENVSLYQCNAMGGTWNRDKKCQRGTGPNGTIWCCDRDWPGGTSQESGRLENPPVAGSTGRSQQYNTNRGNQGPRRLTTNETTSNTKSNTNQKTDIAHRKWLESGRKTYKVEVRRQKQSNGSYKNVYFIDGEAQKTLNVNSGATIRFKYIGNSSLESGYTNSYHPLKISTKRDGPHGNGEDSVSYYVNKGKLGENRNCYVYVTVSSFDLYYYCENHSGMGGKINVTSRTRRGESKQCNGKCYQRIEGELCYSEILKDCNGGCGDNSLEDSPFEVVCSDTHPNKGVNPECFNGEEPCLRIGPFGGPFPCTDPRCRCSSKDKEDETCWKYTVINQCRRIPGKYHGEGWYDATACNCNGCGETEDPTQQQRSTTRSRTTPSPRTTPAPRTTPSPRTSGGGMSSGY